MEHIQLKLKQQQAQYLVITTAVFFVVHIVLLIKYFLKKKKKIALSFVIITVCTMNLAWSKAAVPVVEGVVLRAT